MFQGIRTVNYKGKVYHMATNNYKGQSIIERMELVRRVFSNINHGYSCWYKRLTMNTLDYLQRNLKAKLSIEVTDNYHNDELTICANYRDYNCAWHLSLLSVSRGMSKDSFGVTIKSSIANAAAVPETVYFSNCNTYKRFLCRILPYISKEINSVE